VNTILLTPTDLLIASSLIILDGVLSIALHLDLHRRLAVATVRMVVQLVLVGFVLRWVFARADPALTLVVVVIMTAIATREVAARPAYRIGRGGNLMVGGAAVASATALTAILALTTAIRPTPWYDPHYAVPLTGIILGNVLNGASIALDGILGGVTQQRGAIEARLALGDPFRLATRALRADSLRRAMLPAINQMSAAGIITLPGIMTGQIIAGMDPLEAAKYQILLMFLLAGASALAALVTVEVCGRRLTDPRDRLRLDRLRERHKP
jgi:putative ABC transport system permease protein